MQPMKPKSSCFKIHTNTRKKTLPLSLENKDLCQTKTGSGKTVAFLYTISSKLNVKIFKIPLILG